MVIGKQGMMDKLFKKKNIVITGATGNLGSALARTFINLGGNLLLIGRNKDLMQTLKEELLYEKEPSQTVETACFDFASGDIEARIKETYSKLTSIDVLINNAATHGPIGKFWENDLEIWKKGFEVNFMAAFIFMRISILKMIEQKTGKIINIAGGGATSSRPNFSSYAIAKTGLVRFTEIAAEELNPYNIDINAIAPGVMPSNLLKEVLEYGEDEVGAKEINSAKKAMQEGGSVIKASQLCVFLASDRSNGITGKLISAVWDPWMNLDKHRDELLNSDIYTLRRIIPEDRNKKWEK